MSSSTFKSHFNMISLHEPVQRKARFWTAYVRALKGTEDIRANDDLSSRRRPRASSEERNEAFEPPRQFRGFPEAGNDLSTTARIHAPGYKYLPVSRDTYGYSPRSITSDITQGTNTLPSPRRLNRRQ